MEFEVRLQFGPVPGDELLRALSRLPSLANYEPAGPADEAIGWLYRTSLLPRGELVANTITSFVAIARRSGATKEQFPVFSGLSEWVRGNWTERSVGTFSAWLTIDGEHRLFNFEKLTAEAAEGWPLVERVVSALNLPVKLSPPSRETMHAGGLKSSLIGAPRGLTCEVTGADMSSIFGYFEGFARAVGVRVRETSWSANPLPNAPAAAAYDAVFAARLPAKSTSLSYEFAPPEPELLPRFHALCTNPKILSRSRSGPSRPFRVFPGSSRSRSTGRASRYTSWSRGSSTKTTSSLGRVSSRSSARTC